MTTLPFLQSAPLVAHLADFGGRTALLGRGAPRGGLTYADLAMRVAEFAARLGTTRRLVLVEGASHVDALVAYLGAHAAGCPVLLSGPGAARDAVAAAYAPDVEWSLTDGLVEHRAEPAVELHPDLALLLSTSGTTGSPKLVRLSRRNLVSNATAIADYLGITDADVAATTLPLHYCYGLSVVHSHLLRGAALLLTDRSVADEEFWAEARAHGVTTFAGVPYTFDLLDRVGFAERDLPTLRYVTQAGGRMDPAKVRRFATERPGCDLVVMYGATEATARMAWLPPHLAEHAPETIGIPIPGGTFELAPVEGAEPGVGELVYRGDNVMLGYAESPADLALGRTVHELRTGDLARQRDDGLFQVTGRRSRFAKVFGLRVDLDRVERELAARGVVAAAADGGDRLVVAVATGAAPFDPGRALALVRETTGLAAGGVQLLTPAELPRLANGKTDYRALAAQGVVSTGSTGNASPEAIAQVYADLLGRPDAGPGDTFVRLGGDSLSYVEASVRLERLLGSLPPDWPTRTVADLAALEPGRRVRGTRLETNVLLRAVAMVTVVASHAGLMTLAGGAHVLLAVAGFNIGRFQLADSQPRLDRLRSLGRGALRVAVPSLLVIGTVAALDPRIGWQQALMVTGFTEWTWSEPRWRYWFVDVLLQAVAIVAVLAAIPAIDRATRTRPFLTPLVISFALLPFRWDWVGIPGDHVHRLNGALWLVTMGWAMSKARSTRDRVVVSLVATAMVPGFFNEGGLSRHLYLWVGLMLLAWLPHVRVPRAVVAALMPLASASLWIYLVHWQAYPQLEERSPVLATLAGLGAGLVAWLAWERLVLPLAARITALGAAYRLRCVGRPAGPVSRRGTSRVR